MSLTSYRLYNCHVLAFGRTTHGKFLVAAPDRAQAKEIGLAWARFNNVQNPRVEIKFHTDTKPVYGPDCLL